MSRIAPSALACALCLAALPGAGDAAEVTISCAAVGVEFRLCREGAEAWARESGNSVQVLQAPNQATDRIALYQQLLAAKSPDLDVLQLDIIWPGQLAQHLLDLDPHVPAEERDAHLESLLVSSRIDGKLKALPWFVDVGLLYYRRDLLEKHGIAPPATWSELEEAAEQVLAAEAGEELLGFVFQARAYEGLTCNALEWIDSFGGGRLLEGNGKVEVTLRNPRAEAALRRARGWIERGIAPKAVLNYTEEEARAAFQSGKALFMRNWPYALALAQSEDSPVRGKVGVLPLPKGGPDGKLSGALGGQALAVSRYSDVPEVAADLARYLTSAAEQKRRALAAGLNPTRPALYEDAELAAARPETVALAESLAQAVARPAALAGRDYNRASSIFFNAVHEVLSGRSTAEAALFAAERQLRRALR